VTTPSMIQPTTPQVSGLITPTTPTQGVSEPEDQPHADADGVPGERAEIRQSVGKGCKGVTVAGNTEAEQAGEGLGGPIRCGARRPAS
jgi:hypothetical protein